MRFAFRKFRQGSVTILTVLLIGFMLLAFIYADNVVAMQEKIMTRNDALTEQAFFAAQTCIEEGYLQLRTNEHYVGATLQVNGATCTVSVTSDQTNNTSGELKAIGVYKGIIRTIISRYAGAGPSTNSTATALVHVIDRSGSMLDDPAGCTLAGYSNQHLCESHGGVWGEQPITSAREAAKGMIDYFNSTIDTIGVVSYSSAANREHALSNDFPSVKQSIDDMPRPAGQTNIGGAIHLATQQFVGVASTVQRVEVLLSDGHANRPEQTHPTDPTPSQYALNEATAAKNAGTVMVTIGLGTDVDANLMRAMASVQDGDALYFYAPTGQDLQAIYDEIASTILTYGITQKTWGEQ